MERLGSMERVAILARVLRGREEGWRRAMVGVLGNGVRAAMHPRQRIEFRVEALRAAGQWRDPGDAERVVADADARVDARSNDYLGLARVVSRETDGQPRVGAGASRLISGTHPEHLELEAELAQWLGTEACLLFSSGYAANVGAVSALAGPGEIVFSDSLNHASIIDGCRLSRATVVVLPHRSLEALERALADSSGVRWVVTESYFGMDGDVPDLEGIRRLCDLYGAALVVDEAHALGVFGPAGRGLCAEARVVPDVLIGGMGKAFGVQGGFAACSQLFRAWLWNRARSLVFSTAPSPVLCSLALGQLGSVRRADAERARLRMLEARFAGALERAGVPLPDSRRGPIFPVVLGSEAAVMAAAASLAARGVLCHPIRPPTVPAGGSRLRVTLRADMTESQVDLLSSGLADVWGVHSSGPAQHAGVAPPNDEEGAGVPLSTRALRTADGAHEDDIGSMRPRTNLGTAESEGEGDASNGRGAAGHADAGSGRSSGELGPGVVPRPEGVGRSGEVSVAGADASCTERGGAARTRRGVSAREEDALREGLGVLGDEYTDAEVAEAEVPESRRERSVPGWGAGAGREPSGASGAAPGVRGKRFRWVVIGTGTGVGKSFVARGLVHELSTAGIPAAGLKPIETGMTAGLEELSDAAQLGRLSFHVKLPLLHPLYSFTPPIAPARAARNAQRRIEISRIAEWVADVEANAPAEAQLVIETAGGVFSPLGDEDTNFELTRALDPAIWVLVAPDRLGVLHDVTSCLRAMESLGRRPDYLILSAPEHPDASTGTNADELAPRRSMPPIIHLPRHDASPLRRLLNERIPALPHTPEETDR
jgi:8-amino-7-oxononanoate synthase